MAAGKRDARMNFSIKRLVTLGASRASPSMTASRRCWRSACRTRRRRRIIPSGEARPVARLDPPHQVHEEVAGPRAGVEDVHAGRGQPEAEFRPEDLLDAGAHEIDDHLRRVHDPVRVGDPDRVSAADELFCQV